MTPRVLVSWSSGKDSAWALHVLRLRGTGEVGGLLTTINEVAGRVSMYGVRTELLQTQARAAGLPLFAVSLPFPCSNAAYETRLGAAVTTAVAAGFTHVAFGDLFLDDVRRYREERLAGTGLAPLFPLWHQPTNRLARDMVAAGLRARLTCVDPGALDRTFVGRDFDAGLLDDLPPTVDPCGERGEFHSFAYAGPMFATAIPIENGPVVERDGFVFADLTTSD